MHLAFLGNLYEYYHYGVGEHEFRWQQAYGSTYRVKGLLGVCLRLEVCLGAGIQLFTGGPLVCFRPEG